MICTYIVNIYHTRLHPIQRCLIPNNRFPRSGFELKYSDSGNAIHFSIFTIKIFPPSQTITIPKYNAVSYS